MRIECKSQEQVYQTVLHKFNDNNNGIWDMTEWKEHFIYT